MAALELDPVFVRALKLLHSKNKDSAMMLRTMVDEAISGKKPRLDPNEAEMSEPKKSKTGDTASSSASSTSSRDERKEREREKERQHKRERERREQEKERERLEKEKQKEAEKEKERLQLEEKESDEDMEEYDKSMTADDFAFDLGVCCQVCSKFDITPKNKLVECQECRALYHQECHKPPVVSNNITDPRFVWYCSNCSKNMKKMHALQSQKQSKSKPPPSSIIPSKSATIVSTSKAEPPTLTLPFQRTEKKLPPKDPATSSSSSGGQPFKGLVNLASKSSSSSSSSSSKAESKALLTGWKTEPVKPGHSKDIGDKSSRSLDKSSREGKGDKSASSSSSSSGAAAGSASGSSSGGGKSGSGGSGGAGSGGNGGTKPSMSGSTMASANKRLQLMKKSAAAKQQEKRVHIK